jgi:hypothetical protein
VQFILGEPGVSVRGKTPSNPAYALDSAAGRYLVLGFPPTGVEPWRQLLAAVAAHRDLFDDHNMAFFGVLRSRETSCLAEDSIPGVRWFLDEDHEVSTSYGMGGKGPPEKAGWLVLDPAFRALMWAEWRDTGPLFKALRALPPKDAHAGTDLHAPVLIVPRVFEPDFCRALISAYEANGGQPSGFMREVDGKTLAVSDPNMKIRSDFHLTDGELRQHARLRVTKSLVPQIEKAFAFKATRSERDLVACYDSFEGGFFRAHRDNTTKGTAHRRFAVTVNLNTPEYEGGELVFPEYGSRLYRAPPGAAVVFSCSLLHAAIPVTKGKRYAYLPFLYDDAAAALRDANLKFVAPDLQAYNSGLKKTGD